MCHWRKWIWPGILATILLTALAMMMKSGSIEADLRAKALNDLSSEYSWAEVELDGRDLTLKGIAPSEDAVTEALQIADDAYDVRVATANTTLLPIADPFTFSVTKAGNKISIDGNVSDEKVRADIVSAAMAEFPDGEVAENMTLARGAPADFGDIAAFGLSQLAELNAGSVTLEGLDLSVVGDAKDVASYKRVISTLSEPLPNGGTLAKLDITAPTVSPYSFSAAKSDADVILSGYVPDEATRKLLIDTANAETSGDVTDNLDIALGQPDGFAELASFGIGQLDNFTKGSMIITDKELSVEGTAVSADAYNQMKNALAGAIPGGGKLANADIGLPTISPYTFGAEKRENGVMLTGFVPSEEARTALLDAAKATTSGAVNDRTQLAKGEPNGFDELASFGVAQLSEFTIGSVNLTDNKLAVRGTALTPSAYDKATDALAGEIPAGGEVSIADITRSTVSPFTFSASKTDDVLVLEGYVSSTDEKTNAARFANATNPGTRIVDRLVVANGAPSGVDWRLAGQFAIKEASQLKAGGAQISDTEYSIEGTAKSTADYEMLVGNNELPSGIELRNKNIQRPIIKPYTWAYENPENGVPSLTGYMPEAELADMNIEQIEAKLGTAQEVANSLEIGAGAPVNFAAATSLAIQAASRLTNGKANISGTELMVSGEALSEAAANAVRTSVENGLPAGFLGKHNISVRDVSALPALASEQCQTLLSDQLKGNVVRFESAKSVVKSDSYGLLDRLAFIVKRCSTAIVEIGGHTDSDGSDAANQSLSEARANAVRSFLVGAGVFAGRLRAIGYGETKPVADNATAEGKALNRRIEFKVVQ